MSIEKLYKIIENNLVNNLKDFFHQQGIDTNTSETLLSHSYKITLDKGDIFIPEFENAAICLVESGLLRSNADFLTDNLRNCSFLMKGMTFMGAAPSASEGTNITCLDRAVITVIPGSEIYKEVLSSRAIFDLILNTYYFENLSYRNWAILSSQVEKREHMLFVLILMSLHSLITKSDTMVVRYQDLAEMSGTSMTYALGVVKEAINKGAIEKTYRGLRVLDITKLAQLVDIEPLMEFSGVTLKD